MRHKLLSAAFAATVALPFAAPAVATDLEVTHWWTSGGEAAAVAEFAKAAASPAATRGAPPLSNRAAWPRSWCRKA